jgi:hypothetical protein
VTRLKELQARNLSNVIVDGILGILDINLDIKSVEITKTEGAEGTARMWC